MSTPTSTNALGKRLRSLRGEQSQEAFSQRVGITRSALANYETGRTLPKPSVLRQICAKLGISVDALMSGTVDGLADLPSLLGLHDETATLPGLTEHEKAIVRVLRLCSTETVHAVVKEIIAALEAQNIAKDLADPLTIVRDIEQLYIIDRTEGAYLRGVTPDSLSAILRVLAEKSKAGSPQPGPQDTSHR